MTGLEYGNTRLRAMRSRMLGDVDYRRMVTAGSLERLLAILADSDYAEDVEAAITRYRDLRRLDAVVRRHLTRIFQAMRTFYEPPAAERIDMLLQRWDARNLILLLHALTRPDVGAEVLELLVPAGRLDRAALAELASQPGPRPVIDLLVAWGLPGRDTARLLLRAWPDYELSGDVAVLDRAVMAAFGTVLDHELEGDDSPFARVLRAELDAGNLLTALRLRAGRLEGETAPTGFRNEAAFTPGGVIPLHRLVDLIAADTAEAAASSLADRELLPGWGAAITDWVGHGDLVALAEALDNETAGYAVRLLRLGDPLSLDIAVGFAAAQEIEARNIRWIGRGIVHGLSPDDIDAGVVMVA